MDNSASQRVKDLLSKNDKIGVVVGKNPSVDQMAAALSLYLGLIQSGKNPAIASPTDPIVANSSLVGIDKVKTELAGEGGDLVVSFPYQEGEIEKVSYTLENGYLNIVVKATEVGLSFQQQDVLFKRSGGVPTLLFIVGTPRLSDLGNLFNADALKDTTIVNIDNQAENQGFGDVVLVSSQASSVSELAGSLLDSLQIEITQDIAQNLLSGIAQATDNFQSATTTYMAFSMVGTLMQKGAKRVVAPKPFEPRSNEANKSPFGPFPMPQPRTQNSSFGQQQRPQNPFQPRPAAQKPATQRPWDRPAQQQSRPQMQQSQQQQHVQPQPVAAPQPMHQSQPAHQPQPFNQPPIQQVEHKDTKDDSPDTPPDWLSPKVYKSSTLI